MKTFRFSSAWAVK